MVIFLVVVLVVVCVGGGLWMYFHNGPDGGRDPGLTIEQRRERDLAARLERGFQKEQKKREETPPTHEKD